jgi:DNA-binding beta-propeller fold protein YncE
MATRDCDDEGTVVVPLGETGSWRRRQAGRVAAITLAASMVPMALAATASAVPVFKAPPVPNTVISTISLPIIPEFTSVDSLRGVVWATGLTPAFDPATVEIDESTGRIIRTVIMNAGDYPIGGTAIDPVTGNLIMGTTNGLVSLVNEATGATTEIPVANRSNTLAEGIGVDPITGNIYVSDQGAPNHDTTVSVISQRTDSVTDSIDVPTEAEAIAVDSLTGTVYVSTLVSPTNPAVLAGSVLVINERTNNVVNTIQNVGNLPFSMTLDPLRGELFASNYFQGSLAVIGLRTNTVTTQVTFPNGFAADTPAVDPVNGMVYVNDFDEGREFVVSEKTNALVATIPVPDAAGGIAVDPLRGLVFAGSESPGAGSLAVIGAAPPAL